MAILEVGAATNWNINGGAATLAPNLAAEITPIEGWLELEAPLASPTSKAFDWCLPKQSGNQFASSSYVSAVT
ncbi:MAG: hypothetical protein WBP85_01020 [Terracidiphilus sp.]